MFDPSPSAAALDRPSHASADDRPSVETLSALGAELRTPDFLAAALRAFPGRIALVSSFGAEAAVLLHMAAAIDPALPVIFLDTGKLFGETRRYRDTLIRRLGLHDVRTVEPDAKRLAAEDPQGMLWHSAPDRCCALRKVEPLTRALAPFDAWINGRKRSHGALRAHLPLVERAEGRIKLNPLADWSAEDVAAYFATHDLPHHPLEEDGFTSIGCMPCTDRAKPGEAPRAGRWRGQNKTECGIHLPRRAPAA
jgi:phosphoadenosine phosphosulfate reductase